MFSARILVVGLYHHQHGRVRLLIVATVKQVNYPKTSPTRANYEKCRNPKGNYGGLLSATFHTRQDTVAFFDNLDTVKGPSLGTNFTLSSPYVILAHYGELDWVCYPIAIFVGTFECVTDNDAVCEMGSRGRSDPFQCWT
jgi:hypothetical protein